MRKPSGNIYWGPLIGAFFLSAGVCFAGSFSGYYLEEKVDLSKKVGVGKQLISKEFKRKMFWREKLVRVDFSSRSSSCIIDLTKNKIYRLNHLKKSYESSDLETALLREKARDNTKFQTQKQSTAVRSRIRKNIISKADKANPKIKGLVKGFMREQIDRFYQSRFTGSFPLTLKRGDTIKTFAGYQGKEIRIFQGKKKFFRAFVSDKTGPQNYFRDYAPFIENFNKRISERLGEVTGFPLWQKYKAVSGNQKSSMLTVEVVKVEEREIPGTLFEVPDAYHLKSSQKNKDGLEMEIDDTEEVEEW